MFDSPAESASIDAVMWRVVGGANERGRPASIVLSGNPHVDDAKLASLSLETFPALESLTLDGREISDSIAGVLERLSEVIDLSLAHTKITDRSLIAIGRLSPLISLDLAGTDITDAGLGELSVAQTSRNAERPRYRRHTTGHREPPICASSDADQSQSKALTVYRAETRHTTGVDCSSHSAHRTGRTSTAPAAASVGIRRARAGRHSQAPEPRQPNEQLPGTVGRVFDQLQHVGQRDASLTLRCIARPMADKLKRRVLHSRSRDRRRER